MQRGILKRSPKVCERDPAFHGVIASGRLDSSTQMMSATYHTPD